MPLLDDARAMAEDLVALRRDLHRHPELGFRETRTAALVAERMEALGYAVRTGGGLAVVDPLSETAPRWRCAPTWTRFPSPRRRGATTAPRSTA
ncbi:MAG: hypothetical protein KY453_10480 [Gemmatimonadetes bacterium]|nr:hypothetical protein [Gemmatimonadota bacterium]